MSPSERRAVLLMRVSRENLNQISEEFSPFTVPGHAAERADKILSQAIRELSGRKTPVFEMEMAGAVQESLEQLKKLIADPDKVTVRIGFEMIYDPNSGYTTPNYYAETEGPLNTVFANHPMWAVKKLARQLNLTTVEQYIRLKAAQ